MRAQLVLARPVGELEQDGTRADLRQDGEERRPIRTGGEPEPTSTNGMTVEGSHA
jgi:hypothetical protein